MADLQWCRPSGRKRSWHIVRLWSDRVGRTWTRCGRSFGVGEQSVEFRERMGTPTCETCLRSQAAASDVEAQLATERDIEGGPV